MNRFLNSKTIPSHVERFVVTTLQGTRETELPLKTPSDESVDDGVQNSNGRRGFFASLLLNRFKQMNSEHVEVIDVFNSGSGVTHLGEPVQSELNATVLVADPAFYKRIMLGGTIGSAESYIDGQWVSNDLTSLIRIMIRNLGHFSKLEKTWARIKNSWHFIQHLGRRNSITGSRKNIHEHYDLGNEFYQLFLDPTMNYSSGVFDTPQAGDTDSADMHVASLRKMDQICQKLQLNSLDHVLEIGTGWGGLAIYMAKHYGCQVTTTTISKEQHRMAIERVKAEGLEDRITVLLKDYRELEGKYDKLVSIEMIEAVGHQFYDEYFSRCSDLLTDEGLMLLQSITIGEQNFQYHKNHVDFIRRYVFPGGCLPSVTALASSVGRVTDMRMLYQEDITPHYVKTLAFWRFEFMGKLDQVKALGYDDAFIRMWHFYLCYCEAAFAERRVHNIHLMFAKPKCQIDPSVDFKNIRQGFQQNPCESLS